MTSLTTNQQTINDIFGIHLGRQADTGGLNYWSSQLDAGKTVADVIRGIQSGSEYQGRKDLSTSYAAANDGASPSESYLDQRITPGGGVLDPDAIVNTGPKFAANNTWSSPLMTSGNNTYQDELEGIYEQLKIGGHSGTTDKSLMHNTAAAANTGKYNVGVTHDAAGNPIVSTGTGGTGTGGTGTGDPTQYLTSQGLTDWWNKLDKPWLNQADNTAATNTGGNDDFMKMMMFMAMMRPQGGGGGFGQYGYGGLNPGGVQSAYNPLANLSGYMDAFKTLPGLSRSTISTGTN